MKILHTFKIELKLVTYVGGTDKDKYGHKYPYLTPDKWDWDELLDLSGDEEVEIISCVDLDAE